MTSPAIASIPRGDLSLLSLKGSRSILVSALQGAQVLEWTPDGGRPVLFVSPLARYTSGKAIRGGIPLCFPWFGPLAGSPDSPQHGFARTCEWATAIAQLHRDGSTELALTLSDDSRTRAIWPFRFAARLAVRASDTLRIALEVRNSDDRPFTFEAALHTYLAVSDVQNIRVLGLEDTDYLDKVGGTTSHQRQGAEPIAFTGETDRVYLDTTATCIVDDPAWNRRLVVEKSGSRSTVVWSPWTNKAGLMPDLGPEAWTGFVCIETCNAASDAVTLAPGATHTLEARISVAGR